jgi:hypothetical protein
MDIPSHLLEYRCAEYFESKACADGVWDENSYLWVIVASEEIAVRPDLEFLVIGRPGCDGIEFGYRKGLDGIWAYYPIARQFSLIAPSLSALIDGWLSGELTV